MVRIPYVNKFESQTDLPFWVSYIILCSNIETGIGCFASSIPSLRHFFQRERDGSSGPSSKGHLSVGSKLITGGTNSRRPRGGNGFRNPTDIGFSLSTVHQGRAEDTWERLQDGASDKSDEPINMKGIYAKRSYAVDVEAAPDYEH
ncbi:hypothetical protein N0V94_007905 [Neodidymelliopsis sp. IMI 364377]|nr:hypothetical protein N0V94_007905 [Neodidymelliopsis sp. IMI 364377]